MIQSLTGFLVQCNLLHLKLLWYQSENQYLGFLFPSNISYNFTNYCRNPVAPLCHRCCDVVLVTPQSRAKSQHLMKRRTSVLGQIKFSAQKVAIFTKIRNFIFWITKLWTVNYTNRMRIKIHQEMKEKKRSILLGKLHCFTTGKVENLWMKELWTALTWIKQTLSTPLWTAGDFVYFVWIVDGCTIQALPVALGHGAIGQDELKPEQQHHSLLSELN